MELPAQGSIARGKHWRELLGRGGEKGKNQGDPDELQRALMELGARLFDYEGSLRSDFAGCRREFGRGLEQSLPNLERLRDVLKQQARDVREVNSLECLAAILRFDCRFFAALC